MVEKLLAMIDHSPTPLTLQGEIHALRDELAQNQNQIDGKLYAITEVSVVGLDRKLDDLISRMQSIMQEGVKANNGTVIYNMPK